MLGNLNSFEEGLSNASLLMPKTTISEPLKHNHSISSSQKNKKHHNLSNDIVEVYSENFFKEMERIASLISEYNYVSMVSPFVDASVFMKL